MQRRSKPDLIARTRDGVPILDRRSRKRYLTLRNARNVTLVLVVLFVAITIRSEMQPRHGDAFGRILEREMPAHETKPVEVVKEAAPPIDDQTSPDPMLVAPMAREQWLHADDTTATTSASIEPIAAPLVTTIAPGQSVAASKVTIVGGADGVSIVREHRRRQTLRGGFGR